MARHWSGLLSTDRAAEQEIRPRIPPEPKEIILEQPDVAFVSRRIRETEEAGILRSSFIMCVS
jgi:hypothetical protein